MKMVVRLKTAKGSDLTTGLAKSNKRKKKEDHKLWSRYCIFHNPLQFCPKAIHRYWNTNVNSDIQVTVKFYFSVAHIKTFYNAQTCVQCHQNVADFLSELHTIWELWDTRRLLYVTVNITPPLAGMSRAQIGSEPLILTSPTETKFRKPTLQSSTFKFTRIATNVPSKLQGCATVQ